MRVLFLFPGRGRHDRLARRDAGAIPREFFYGLPAIEADGNDVRFADNRRDPTGWVSRTHLKWEILRNRLMQYGTSSQRVHAVAGDLRWADIALSFTDGFSISLGLHGRRHGTNTRLVGGFHGISTFTERASGPMRSLATARTKAGLHGLDHAFFFGEADRRFAVETYGLDESLTSLFRFGVDTQFWTPAAEEVDGRDGVVFAAGSDPSRDYGTLLAAPFMSPLRILTGLKLESSTRPVEQIAGSFHGMAITDAVLRDIYRRAAVIAVPLRDVLQPTGYSVTLQAMACGKPIVLSDIRGLWDRSAFVSGENCLLVRPNDPVALGEAISRLVQDADLRRRLGIAARRTAERVFPLARMDKAIRALVARLNPSTATSASAATA